MTQRSEGDHVVPADTRAKIQYQPTYCAILRKHVWAIVMKQADGSWKIVNCLDKDEGCFSLDCAFTTDHGEWPYRVAGAEAPKH